MINEILAVKGTEADADGLLLVEAESGEDT
jgi:hypothetical protein